MSGHQPREAIGEILRFMRFLADDPSIAIDEAVGFAKKYASDDGARLVNGILGRIQREEAA